jgi:hypothetical protein
MRPLVVVPSTPASIALRTRSFCDLIAVSSVATPLGAISSSRSGP